jgi:hypothetical protein
VTGAELPGPLQLCFAHTEQYRQNRDGWKIDWAAGASEPTSVFAPTNWEAAPLIAPVSETPAADPKAGAGPAWLSGPARLREWTRERRAARRDQRD